MKKTNFLKTCLFLSALTFLCGWAFAGKDFETKTPAIHSKLVYPGADGRLVYVPDEKGNTVPDFSYAGYMGGGVKLPEAKVKITLRPSGANDDKVIQAAIDKLSEMPVGKDGFRGAILLKKGRYVLENPLRISESGIVLRGEGQGVDGTILFGVDHIDSLAFNNLFNDTNLILIKGSGGSVEIPGTETEIIDSYVPVGSRSFGVKNPESYKAGDKIIVKRFGGREWYRELKIDYDRFSKGFFTWEPRNDSHDFERTVTGVEKGRLFIDAPLTVAVESVWGGGKVVKYSDEMKITNVAVENLRGMSGFDKTVKTKFYGNMDRLPYEGAEYYSDEYHYWNFIKIENAYNCWVKNVTAVNFASSCVFIAEHGKWITVQDCVSLDPVSDCVGGHRYTFQMSGQLCLIQRCSSDKGRHSFVLTSLQTCGPNVFLDCIATRPYGSSEPHANLIVGSLYDNVHAPLAFRFAKSDPARWMGINSYAWNCEGMFINQKPPTAQNYFIGQVGIHAMIYNKALIDYGWPDGYIESLDEHVAPRSLYLKQLEDRLGKKAVKNIAKPEQM